MGLKDEIIRLFGETATQLPEDIIIALEKAERTEDDPISKDILGRILANVGQAKKESKPICQDTGIPIFYVEYPRIYSQEKLKRIIEDATAEATNIIPLRPNAVDSLTGENTGNKPFLHFEESDNLKIDLLLKGGGSENVSSIYQLPNSDINAGRDLDGVRRCILDSIFKAQGKGCPPYIVGVAIGGSIEEVAYLSKKQLLRKIDDKNTIDELNNFEECVLEQVNQLGIGPMGLGGKTTALSIKIENSMRHPASFFVGISIGCWCLRRQTL